jgi:hypothetical protein
MYYNYVVVIKQDLDKILSVSFIAPMEEANCHYIEK